MDDKNLKKILNKGGSVDLSGNRLTGYNIKLICNYISGNVIVISLEK
ncbi:MAG: hypothetical protein HRU35_07280 [Rickettsiaceae bacterium]|nr:hypothetical protein [Rickettsiaceae bacterium]